MARNHTIKIKVSTSEREKILQNAHNDNFTSLATFARHVLLNHYTHEQINEIYKKITRNT